jgi:ubiquinone/menaquinone biosynthesis C-methylase UbiE
MKLNKICNLEDWADPDFRATVRRLEPGMTHAVPAYPTGFEHRKQWEYAHVLNGLDRLGATHPAATVLSVAGGHELPAFDLTNRVRWVFLTDLYGDTHFSNEEAQASVLTNPDPFSAQPYNRNRLVVQHMNALDLRFEPETFDAVFCLSSIEHFGGEEAARHALAEMDRVTKPGGVVAITTECIIDDGPDYLQMPDLMFFSHKTLERVAHSVPGLELVEPMAFEISDATRQTTQSLTQAILDMQKRLPAKCPHVVLEHQGRLFTSVALFFRKRGTAAPVEAGAAAPRSQRDHSEFLRAVYRGCLGREPDAKGLVDYRRMLEEGALDWAGVLHSVLGSDEFSRVYEIQRAGDRAMLALHQTRVKLFQTHLPPAEVAVDLGGASAYDPEGALFAMGYPHTPRELYIVDLSPTGHPSTVEAKRGTSIHYIQGSMSDLSAIPDETADLVVSGESIEHVSEEEADRVFAEAFRVLRPGGHFCLDTPNARLTRLQSPDQFGHPEHKKEYLVPELTGKLARHGFRVAAVKGLCRMPASLAAGKFDPREMVRGSGEIVDAAEDCYVFFADAIKPEAGRKRWPFLRGGA